MARKLTEKRLLLRIAIVFALLSFSHEGLTAADQVLPGDSGDEMVLYADDPRVVHTMEVQNHYTPYFMDIPGVIGTGTGMTETGEPAILVFTTRELGPQVIPVELEGLPVIERVSGETTLLGNGDKNERGALRSGTGQENTIDAVATRYSRPVPIGVSTSNWNECAAGTIGVRVRNGNNVYVLSCNHVFARLNYASSGEKIVQPGRGDVSCAQNTADEIGTLADYEPIVYGTSGNNIMDAALVSTNTNLVDASTPLSDGYGAPNRTTATAYIGMDVQKYGRTTGLTQGEVVAINFNCTVPYPAGPSLFNSQIVVQPKKKNSDFAGSGDSGALVVTDDNSVNPVGMLFASSGSYIYVSPIDPILSRFNVEIDDGTPNINPVELVSFSGAMVGQDVQLKWHTATEVENFGFFVQRSTDKKTWTDIDMIPGAGTVNTPRSYRYTDAGIARKFAGQTLYYRLLQLDRDGTEDFSSILTIENTPAPASMQVYPHPVRSNATVQLQLNQPAEGHLHVYDASGRRLDILTHSLPLVQGTHIVPLSLSSVSPGYYFLEFESAGTVVRKRILVVR